MGQPEARHGTGELLRLVAQALGGRGTLLDQRGVLLRHLVELLHRVAHLADALALLAARGADLAHEIVRHSDFVLECFPGPSAEKLGLTYDEMKKVKPDIIMISVSLLGKIGLEVARRARAFGMDVVAHDPYVSATVAQTATIPANARPAPMMSSFTMNAWQATNSLARGDLAVIAGTRSHHMLHAQLVLFSPLSTSMVGGNTGSGLTKRAATPSASPTHW